MLQQQQQQHENEILRHRSTHRDSDRQMLADVWQQSLYDDGSGLRASSSRYGAGMLAAAGLPAMSQPEEEEADEEHEAGDTFMVHACLGHVAACTISTELCAFLHCTIAPALRNLYIASCGWTAAPEIYSCLQICL